MGKHKRRLSRREIHEKKHKKHRRPTWKEKSGLKKEMKIKKLMMESKDHNHEKCDCKGCYWWCMTRILLRNGRLYEVVPSWKDMDRDEYLRIVHRTMQYKMDKKIPYKKLVEYLIKQKVPKDQAPAMAKKMLDVIFVVMYGKAPSPLGLLRDI